jgi:uncharacterized repeat protein (TIGR01451 family)
MKKLYTLLVVAFIGFAGNAQIISFPDSAFKSKLLQSSPTVYIAFNSAGTKIKIDTNSDGNIQVSEALAVYKLIVSDALISDLTGVEYFTNLQYLDCSANELTSLNLTGPNSLTKLYCNDNHLALLDISTLSNLIMLNCVSNDNLASFNLNTSLKELYCSYNGLTGLDETKLTNLTHLSCHDNNIGSLDVTNMTNLVSLICLANHIPSLNLSGLVNLQALDFGGNPNCTFDLTNLVNLQSLGCGGNHIATLDLSHQPLLNSLSCGYNQLTSLDLSHQTLLGYIYCAYNQISTLDVSHQTQLNNLDCSNNNLTSIFMKNGKSEGTFYFGATPNLQYICCDPAQLASVQSLVSEAGYTNPNCVVNSYCSFTPGGTFYTIAGNTRYDETNNGCEPGDLDFAHLRFTIADTSGNLGAFYTDDNGHYAFPIPSGTYTLTPTLEDPSYYSIFPASKTITFPTASNPYIQDFCVTAIAPHNDLEVAIVPLTNARPGFDAYYKIIYKNKGTGPQSGSVSLTFDDTREDFVSAIPTISGTGVNSLSWNFTNLHPFETREIMLTLNTNSPVEIPAVNSGDILSFTTAITGLTDETPSNNIAPLNQIAINSYDPNNKTCAEGTTISPSMVGDYVHYVIRFENNGTANAQNIVVKDVIDTAKFNINSLVPLTGSHPYIARVTNPNQVEFIFENIQLPFDDANNDGYVVFKIKTKSTLVVGNTFTNKANIYFDYNFPIITNTYTTTVQTLGNQDFEFNSLFSLSPVPAKDTLRITAKETVAISSVNIYNMLGQLVQVTTNPNETIDVSGLKTGSYFIRILSDKGASGSKFVKE